VNEPAWSPLCMEPDEWADWQRLNPVLNQAIHAERPCADCPVGYARQMRAIRRCNGTPGLKEENDPVAERDDLTTIEVASDAPCPSCVHRTVCGMRTAVESLRKLEILAPSLPKAVRTVISVEVECSEFLRDRSAANAKHSATSKASWTPEKRALAAERLRERRARGELIGRHQPIDASPEARKAREDAFVAAAEDLEARKALA
jgi:hypothetical protein